MEAQPAEPLLARLNPVDQVRAGRMPRRLTQLLLGLVLYGITMAAMLRAKLGNDPWDVFHQGLAHHLGLSFGTTVILVSFVVLLFWIPLREWPGLGTLCNAVIIGASADLGLHLLSTPSTLGGRIGFAAVGILGNAVATAAYVGAQLGPGPRDGLMTGLHRRTGLPIGLVRTGLEGAVVVGGLFLGGLFGVATIVYAITIGPLVQLLLPRFVVRLDAVTPRQRVAETRTAGPLQPVLPVRACDPADA
ncbi:MAG: YczE/YyaS/YitT family protein [Marmoricola sp.]